MRWQLLKHPPCCCHLPQRLLKSPAPLLLHHQRLPWPQALLLPLVLLPLPPLQAMTLLVAVQVLPPQLQLLGQLALPLPLQAVQAQVQLFLLPQQAQSYHQRLWHYERWRC